MTDLARNYGGIFSLKRFSGTIIVLSDWGYVKSLLDKRSAKYSHRPKSLVSDMITGGHHILMMDYDETWRVVRKLIHQTLMETRCDKEHYILQEAEANQMLYDFMTKPEENMLHPKRYSNSITMSIGKMNLTTIAACLADVLQFLVGVLNRRTTGISPVFMRSWTNGPW
jgi:cytochrome P450